MAAIAPAVVTHSSYIEGLRTLAVNRRFKHTSRAASELLHSEGLTQCAWSDEWCDCHDTATVHVIATEREVCLRHLKNELEYAETL